MAPPTSSRVQENYNPVLGVCELPEAPVQTQALECTAENSYSPAQQANLELGARFRASYRQSLLTRSVSLDASQLTAALSGGSNVAARASSDGAAILMAGPFAIAACGSNNVEQLPPIDEEPPPDPDQGEDPDPIPGQDGIASVDGGFAGGQCLNPASMVAMASSILMFCGDDSAVEGGDGVGRIEEINPSSGAADVPFIPVAVGDTYKISSGAVSDGIVIAGLAPSGTVADYESTGPDLLQNSGLLAFSKTGGVADIANTVLFDELTFDFSFPLANVENPSEQQLISTLVPNTPVSMAVVGNTVYVLNANRAFNNQAALDGLDVLDYAPATVHAYTLGGDGSLTPATVGDVEMVVNGELTPGHAYPLFGQYAPAAIADVGDGRLAVLIRGIGGGDNPSKVIVFDPSDPGNTSAEYSITDSAGLNFWAGTSNQLNIVDYNDAPHALVGAGDGSGRLAMVNLDDGTTTYVGVFTGDANVQSISVNATHNVVVVTSSNGEARTVNLGEVDEITGLPTVGQTHTIPADPKESAIIGNNVIVAHPMSYTRIVTQEPIAGE